MSVQSDEVEGMISPKELCQLLHIELRTLYSWRQLSPRKRPFPFYSIGRSLRFRLSEVNDYIERSRIR